MYYIIFKHSAEKELSRIDKQFAVTIVNKIDALRYSPLPPQSRKLTGSETSYRIRVNDYRVIYMIDAAEKIITVVHIRHRKDVYKHLD